MPRPVVWAPGRAACALRPPEHPPSNCLSSYLCPCPSLHPSSPSGGSPFTAPGRGPALDRPSTGLFSYPHRSWATRSPLWTLGPRHDHFPVASPSRLCSEWIQDGRWGVTRENSPPGPWQITWPLTGLCPLAAIPLSLPVGFLFGRGKPAGAGERRQASWMLRLLS